MLQDQRSDQPPNIGDSVSQFGFWEIDLRDMALALPDTTCTIHGLGPAACGLDDFLQRVHPDERQHVSETLHAALRAGARLDVDYRVVRPSGEERHVRLCAEPLPPADDRVHYLGTAQDVTEQVQRGRDAGRDARLLKMACMVAHIGGWTYDTFQGRVIWSDEVCRIHATVSLNHNNSRGASYPSLNHAGYLDNFDLFNNAINV